MHLTTTGINVPGENEDPPGKSEDRRELRELQ